MRAKKSLAMIEVEEFKKLYGSFMSWEEIVALYKIEEVKG